MKIDVLGVSFDAVNRKEALNILMDFLKGETVRTLFTPNPEMVMEARKDDELLKILNSGDLVVPDGIGIVWASRFSEKRIRDRVAGYDLIQDLFDSIKNTDYTVYFFGGGEGIAHMAKLKIEKKYKNIKIVGAVEGYFDSKKEKAIINHIKRLKPDILLVGLGSPKQEKWIFENKEKLPVKIIAGVGGSFDGYAEKFKRAPDILIKLNLEWFYRLLKQPKRIGRQLRLPMFVISVISNHLFKEKS